MLGPLLFLIYINDLHHAIKNSKTIHFADDTSLVCKESSLKKINFKINQDLVSLTHWLRANKISLNTSKTEIIIFKNKNKTIHKNLNFRLSGRKMKLSKHVTYLGMTIDENLDWDLQLSKLYHKLSRTVEILSKLRYYLSFKTLSVYYALFESHYCIQCLGHVNQASLEKIEKLQKKAIRIIHFKGPRDHTKVLFINSRILPVKKLIKVKNCLFAFDFFKNTLPNYFQNFLTPLGFNHNHSTRASAHSLATIRTRTIKYGTYNISNLITKDWNDLHSCVPDMRSISKSTFKKHLHAFILTELATG